jgi:non-ribosomal peptide synthetase component F
LSQFSTEIEQTKTVSLFVSHREKTTMSQSDAIENLLHELRAFAPEAEFTAQAVARASIYDRAAQDRLGFWAEQANQLFWHKPFTKSLNWSEAPFAKWFEDGEINVAYNCLDRHVAEGRGDRVAIHFEGEPGDTQTYTYTTLTEAVKRAANVLTDLGVTKGDRVAIYLPHIPEAIISMLAVASLWRFQRRIARNTHSGCWGKARDHSRWRLPPRQGFCPQASCRRSSRHQ